MSDVSVVSIESLVRVNKNVHKMYIPSKKDTGHSLPVDCFTR
jgi:hypothetical protein